MQGQAGDRNRFHRLLTSRLREGLYQALGMSRMSSWEELEVAVPITLLGMRPRPWPELKWICEHSVWMEDPAEAGQIWRVWV